VSYHAMRIIYSVEEKNDGACRRHATGNCNTAGEIASMVSCWMTVRRASSVQMRPRLQHLLVLTVFLELTLTVDLLRGSIGRGSIGRNVTFETDMRVYPAKYQPEYDRYDIAAYFSNPRVIRHFVRCLFYGEICDLVGKWAKREEL